MKLFTRANSLILFFYYLLTIQVTQAQCPPTTWTSRAVPLAARDNDWRSVTYGNGLFVAVASNTLGNAVMTSPDGINWTIQTSAADNNWRSVTYGNGLFVAVGIGGIGNRVMTSPDGINWTIRASAADNNWRSVTYGNGLFVAVSSDGAGNRVMTSPNGINWTIRTSAADNFWRSVTYGNGLFVAVSDDGTGNRVMTSPNGINWTIRTSAVDNSWRSLTYGNGLFVAVSSTGTGNRVMTSPDGVNWTIRTPAADNQWGSVTYGNGIFVAVASTGIGNRVMISPDGINWTSRTSAANISWNSVIHGNGIFVAVGEDPSETIVVMTGSPTLVTPSVTIGANPSNSVATGTSVTFTATPANGGSTPIYQWKKNGNNVGANSVNYTDAALQHGDIITCVLTSNDPCASPTIATSNGISMIIPGIGLVGTISAMATPVGTASASQSFTVSGSSLTNNIVVTAPTGFEVSLSANSGYGASVSLTPNSGTVNATTVFVRLAAATAVGTYSGNIVCSSTGFTSKNIAIPSSQVGIQASALNFDGVNDVVQVAAATTKFDLPALTGECWVKRDAMNGTNVCLFASRSTTATRFSVHMGNSSIGLFNGATFATVNSISFAANTWYHIAVILRTTGGMDVYVNGSYAGTTSNSMGTTTNLPFQIGSSIPNGTFESLNGTLDELRIWNTARTASEIANNYLNVISNPSGQANLISYYNFNNGVSNGSNAAFATLTDLANNPLNGTLINFSFSGSTSNWVESYAMVVPTATAATNITSTGFTANWTAPATGTVSNYLLDVSTNSNFTSFVSGYNGLSVTGTSAVVTGLAANNLTYYYRVRANNSTLANQGAFSNTITAITTTLVQPGNALNFDGTNDYVDLGSNPALAATNFKTIECWVRFNNFNNQEILSKSIAGSGTELLVFNGNLGYFNMNATSGAVSFINYATSNLATGLWYHIAAAWNGLDRATMRLYLNGVAVGTRTDVGTLTSGNTNPAGSFRIGTWSDAAGGRFLNGTIDEVRIWSSERTATQIANNYRTILNNPTSEANLLAYYNFDNGIAGGNNAGVGNLPDLTTNNLNGTLQFFTLNGNTSNWVNSTLQFPPTITSFTPLSAIPGDAVTITGTNFNATPSNNIVFFGATRATVTAATATQLTVTVPTGATYAPITLLNTGISLACASLSNFNPIYSPAKTNITASDFSTKVDFATARAYDIAMGDLDGDGKPDLAVANHRLSVFRNTATYGTLVSGSFAARQDFTTASTCQAVAFGDLDGDGKLDLAVANVGTINTISIFRNTSTNGNITFASRQDFLTGTGPVSIAIRDLDGDGKPDIVTSNALANTISVYLNYSTSGSIGLVSRQDFTTAIQPQKLALGDLDGDGKADVVVANGNSVSAFPNTSTIGSIGFGTRLDFATGTNSNTRSVAIGDLDGDGKPDIVTSNTNTNSISAFRNTSTSGNIGFGVKQDFGIGGNSFSSSVAIGDMDGDGKADLAAVNKGLSSISVLRSTSTNGNIDFAAKQDFTTATGPNTVAIGDLDGDDKLDLVTGNFDAENISVLRNADVNSTTWNGTIWTNGTPTATMDAIIASSITIPDDITCKALRINSGITFNTSSGFSTRNVTVNGNINNLGNGIGGSGRLTIASNATISGNAINLVGFLTVNSGVVLNLNGLNLTVGTLEGAGTITSTATGNLTLTIGGSHSSSTFNGIIQNGTATSIGLTKMGFGTFTLTQANTYTGTTTVNVGTLVLNKTGGGTLASTTSCIVNNGGTIEVNTNQTLAGITLNFGATVNVASSAALINIATITINSGATLDLMGAIEVASGATIVNNGTFILRSDATNTGRIANSAGTITGNVTIERFIPGGRRAFRFLGHPFTTAQAMSSLIDDIFVTGDGTINGSGSSTGAGLDATLTNDPSSYWFDNTTNTWKSFTTAADASWAQHRGTRILVRGDRTQTTTLTGANPTPLAVTLDMTGAVNTGNQNISLPTANNYHLLSNPYPSPTDIGTVIQSASNVGTLYWVWNANAGSRGQYVNRLIADGAYNLAMNGAFFVQPTAATSLAFTEANKTATATQALYRTASSTRPAGYLELAVKQNNEVADNIYIRDLASALTTKDVEDGGKLINPDINIYTLTSNNEQLTLDARPISSTTVIPVVFTSNIQSSFSIEVIDNGFGNGLPIVLKDKFLNTEHVLTATSPYNFTVTNNTASQGNNRFELVFKSSAALPTTFVNVAAQQKGAAIEVTFNTANETNMHSYEVEESKDGSSFTKGTTLEAKNAATNNYSWLDVNVNNGNNYYRVKAIEKNGAVKYSQVVRVNIGTKRSEFTVYPNPVKGGTINLQLTDIEKGIYTVKVVNNLGQEIAAKQITHNGGSANQTINIGNASAGKYNMVITNGTTSVTKTVIVE